MPLHSASTRYFLAKPANVVTRGRRQQQEEMPQQSISIHTLTFVPTSSSAPAMMGEHSDLPPGQDSFTSISTADTTATGSSPSSASKKRSRADGIMGDLQKMRQSCQRSRDELFGGDDIETVAQDVRKIRNAVRELVEEHYRTVDLLHFAC